MIIGLKDEFNFFEGKPLIFGNYITIKLFDKERYLPVNFHNDRAFVWTNILGEKTMKSLYMWVKGSLKGNKIYFNKKGERYIIIDNKRCYIKTFTRTTFLKSHFSKIEGVSFAEKDFTHRIINKDILLGLKNCTVVIKKRQLENLDTFVDVIKKGNEKYYISHLEQLRIEAKQRNINIVPPEGEY